MTFEAIMDAMMQDMPDGLDTSEGSLIYHACVKQAARLEQAYIDLDALADNQYPDTADLDHLVKFGQERGIYIEEATAAIFEGKFNVAVEIGTEFSGDDYNYIVTDVIDENAHTYKLECEDAGSEANGWLGDLMCLDDVEDLEDAELTKLLVEGKDEEDEESYRMRLLDSFEIKPFAGNKKYYVQEIGNLDGVGGVKVYRRTGTNISVIIITEDFRKPDEAVVSNIQTQVDPTQNSGEGIGIAPIGHCVVVTGADEFTVNVSASIVCESGYTVDGLKTQIETAVETYMSGLRQTWADSDHLVVRLSGVENAIYNVEGVEDIKNVLLNNSTNNLILNENEIPVKGAVACS